jgi:NAD-dependent dihydropyrimidine dehydrogenase PreA subunit
MCLSCEEHVVQRLWYLEEQSHISSGMLTDAIDRIMYPGIVLPGLRSIKKRQPYSTEHWAGVSRILMDWIAKSIHGFQVLPDLESTFKVIDLSNEIGLSICTCRKILSPDQPEAWKCIGLNNAARITFKHDAQPFRVITKEEAKQLVAERREAGCFQSVGWRLGPNVTWVCNCDEYCGCHRTPEIEWGMIPSFFVSDLVKPESCDGCQVCTQSCHRGAIGFDTNGWAVIDAALCLGCGQCVEHCPNQALALVPRKVYFDVVTRRRVELPDEVFPV